MTPRYAQQNPEGRLRFYAALSAAVCSGPMPTINLHILRLGDPVPFEGDRVIGHRTDVFDLIGIEHGMESGSPSVAFRVELPDLGGVVIVETSLAALITVMAGLWGAFPEPFAERGFGS